MKEFTITITLLLLLGAAAEYRLLPISYGDAVAENLSDENQLLIPTQHCPDEMRGCESTPPSSPSLANGQFLSEEGDGSTAHPSLLFIPKADRSSSMTPHAE